MFVPEPQVIDNYLKQSIVPIDVGMVSTKTRPRYSILLMVFSSRWTNHLRCAMAPSTSTVSLPIATFPIQRRILPLRIQNLRLGGPRVPAQFVIYNAGLSLWKGAGPDVFETALDIFYKQHKVETYPSINGHDTCRIQAASVAPEQRVS